MTVVWGFNLSEMHWGAFGSERMFDKRWHLRKERFIVYQIAMLTALAAECTATYSLSKYNFHQTHIEEATDYAATELNNDLVNSAIATICFCVFVATLFGADFFFLVFWPRRRYPAWYRHTKLALAVVITLGMLGSAIASTVIIATQSARIVGVDEPRSQELVNHYFRPPLRYRSWPQNIAWVVLLWIAVIFTLASAILMFKAASHDERYGTEPRGELDPEDKALSQAPVRKSRSRLSGDSPAGVDHSEKGPRSQWGDTVDARKGPPAA